MPVLWMGEEDVRARNPLDVDEFSLEKPMIASLRGKVVIIA